MLSLSKEGTNYILMYRGAENNQNKYTACLATIIINYYSLATQYYSNNNKNVSTAVGFEL